MTRIIAFGDVIGKPGRTALREALPRIQEQYAPDFVIVNGENAAGGFGLTRKVYDELLASGVDCITMGNHWHDKREIYQFVDDAERLVLPANMMNVSSPKAGFRILSTKEGRSIAVMNLIGCAFMHPDNRSPFKAADQLLGMIGDRIKIRVVDFHGEATSEKQGIAAYLAGKVSLTYGTHSHVPTADERILKNYTGFVTDLGMTGPYDSVIGIRTDAALRRLLTGEKKHFEPASGELWSCFIVADICDETGACTSIERKQWRPESIQEPQLANSTFPRTVK
jgi:2',3'-cyclic-nucleotide 2'-phosphodiesterase